MRRSLIFFACLSVLLAGVTVLFGVAALRNNEKPPAKATPAPPPPPPPKRETDLRVPTSVTGPVDVEDFDLGLLAPPDGRVRRIWQPAADQVLVEWTAIQRPSLYTDDLTGPWGLILWTRTRSRGFASRWRPYELPLDKRIGTGAPKIDVGLGDVTSDGRRDVLVAQYRGNHGCGPHRVVATIGKRPRVIFRGDLCESSLSAHNGLLRISSADYTARDSMCCPSFFRVTLRRWSGRRLVSVSSRRISQRPF